MAAFLSRSTSSPQASQRNTRRDRESPGPSTPHREQLRVDGKSRGATMSRAPYQLDLYSSIRRNIPKPTSATERERRPRAKAFTERSSTTIADLVFASAVVTL